MKKVNRKTINPSPPPPESWLERHSAHSSKFGTFFIVLIFFGLGFGVYSNTFESPFVFDDNIRILGNPDIRLDEISVRGLWNAAFGRYSAKSRPIGNMSFALNYYANQYRPAGYHLVNITVHIITGILLWLFLKKTLMLKASGVDKSRAEWMALAAALLWLVNPIQTQSVTYIVQRLNSMAAMFFLLSFLFFLNGRLSAKKGPRWAWFAAAAVGWFLALGCKQNTATLPFFILLYEWYFFRDLNAGWIKQNLKYVFMITAVFAIIAFIFLGPNPVERLTSIADYANKEFSLSERLFTQFRVVVFYLTLILFPHPARQNLDYDFPLSVSLFDPVSTLLSAMGLVGLLALAVVMAKKQRLISFCIFWFLGNLVIESSIIPIAIIFEHRLYLPSMLVWLVPIILIWRYVKFAWLTIGLSCVLLALFSYWTFERNKVWRDAVTLWADCANKSPNKARIYNNLGTAQFRQNMIAEAQRNVSRALALDPEMADAHYNLGRLLEEEDKTSAAIERYRKAIELAPALVPALNNLGVALLKRGEIDESVELFHRALKIEPWFAQTHSNLGLAKFKQGKIDAAIAHYTKAVQLDPALAEAHFKLGEALLAQGKMERGILSIEKALQIDPDYAEAHNNLGGHLLRQDKTDKAYRHLTRAISLDPDLAEAHNNLGIILIRQGDLDAAISHFRQALRLDPDFELASNNLQKALALPGGMDSEIGSVQRELDTRPDDPELRFKLGNLHLRKGELDKAVAEFERALALRPDYLEAQNNLAMAYAAGRQYDRALAAFKKLIELDPGNSGNYYNISVLYALQNNVPQSITWLKKAIDRGYQNWDLIKTDKDLANIRSSEEYKNLVKGH